MAYITYNDIESPSNILTYSDVPNILDIEESITGSKAEFTLTFSGDVRSTVTGDSQYYITFLGETISNVMNASDAKNKRFYASGDEEGTAMSVCRALRACGGISADFNVIHSGATVTIMAKTIGEKWADNANYFSTNIGATYLTTSGTDGTSYSVYYGAKIDVDVYSGDTISNENYITTLEKNFYQDNCYFNMSPVLATISEFGTTTPYIFNLNLFREDGEWQNITTVSGMTTVGYNINNSDKYKLATGVQMLLNNNIDIIRYTYSNVIDYSVLCGTDTSGWQVQIECVDNALNEVYSTAFTAHLYSTNQISDQQLTIPSSHFEQTYVVDITVGSDRTRHFKVIKPLKATEYYQRVYWRNEYGGIEYFDFTGARSEQNTSEIETYEKNVFDYYTASAFEKKRIYKNDYNKVVTLTSHLMEEDATPVFNSLMKSKRIWTTEDGITKYIIPKTIEVSEEQAYNGIYTVKFSYEYSNI